VAGSAHRQIARTAGCHHSTVTRRAQRVGRHSLVLHELLLDSLPRADEPIILDDFDGFASSQYFPCTMPTAVGARTWFVYGFAFAPERRRGHMSGTQKMTRAWLERRYGRPRRGEVTEAFKSLLERLPGSPQHIVADADPAIRRAVAARPPLRLEAHPNPRRGPKGSRRSRQALIRDRALFPNDQLHRFLRHSQAAHRRETIAFGRSFNGLLERLALFVVWRNLVQARSERRPRDGTTAMRRAGLDRPWSWSDLFARRLQPSRVGLHQDILKVYRRGWVTPPLPNETRHTLSRAF
jgi:hypothetical protein